MDKKSKKCPHAFYERGSWYHRTKILQEDYSVKYGKTGGFSTDVAAEEAYKQHIDEFNRRMNMRFINREEDITFKNYMIFWYVSIFSERIKSTTRLLTSHVLYHFILPNVDENIVLKFVSTDYVNRLLEKTSCYCESAANKSREVLYIAMKDAVMEQLIRNNPVKAAKRYPRKKSNIKILSKNQIYLLLKEAKRRNWFLEILLGLYCGLRKGEILGLKFEDFDLQRQTVTIQRQLVVEAHMDEEGKTVQEYELVLREPKSEKSNLILKVPMIVWVELEKRKEKIAIWKQKKGSSYKDSGLISCQKNGLPHSRSSLNSELNKVCKMLDIPRISVHGLRHMYATALLEKGVSLAKISALLGHSSVNTTFEFYVDIMEENTRIMDFMNKEFLPESE